MSRALPYWHVDAFTDRAFGGNQAAVMPLDDWLDDDLLLAIAGENNFAETAFCVRDASGEADWELRWFTPAEEVRLCGHATLASGHVLLARDGGERVRFCTRRAGTLEVVRAGAGYELALPLIRAGRVGRSCPTARCAAAGGLAPSRWLRGLSVRQRGCCTCARSRSACAGGAWERPVHLHCARRRYRCGQPRVRARRGRR